MNKRRIFIIIIFIGTMLQFILGNFVFSDFPGIISFILLVPFYLIVYLYYQRYKYIKYICFFSIFTVMANYFLFDYLDTFSLYSNKIRLIGMVSFFGSLIVLLWTFILLLQNQPKSKLLKGLFVFIVLVNYFFFSYYIIPLLGILEAFFGPDRQDIDNMHFVIQIVIYVLQMLSMFAQIIIINILDNEEKYFNKVNVK